MTVWLPAVCKCALRRLNTQPFLPVDCVALPAGLSQVVCQAQKGQEALERRVAMLETHQLEIHNALVTMEDEALRLHRVSRAARGRIWLPACHQNRDGTCPC